MQVTLYTKPGCHLCDAVKFELLDLQDEIDFELNECNILENPALFAAYHLRIPVVEIEGHTPLSAPIAQADLRKTLRSVAKRTDDG